ncbi:DsbE family thiol:disulfide interchange protein [Pseudorhizobium marinum]|jgi:cytochrome c biogenesis protein CcmG, thiol:disulfide interchange protein DsbE|uniref:DsbE family thiol:disulfide interchange protein n=1 Tax=Pseudorhizobium marinum TaxID=1496690 RepID=UPI000496296B|nr:DsbE family thiol:disulfide interchange protein [Pseudorhizobium marinum]MBU1316125.1 DsbE family thiol:disulfide interchange protein [Alphaproteobacteria bacterium]MBU1549873.1 DsbE family thiol:disulfide interchange protein [Alphaproteobacteria bacterium]MBU2336671.1 DsbE family thiol:disulfide interchange protein [Alphaproteobacteria bacterium]MBU2387404.1 DsbE family thiol:disulfide interchange protein [Alphaproteobacteria bacterium]|tara:strand:- start:598 stop:1197 length:600 start_codon:yes stop_codon:yes gene_type:complete
MTEDTDSTPRRRGIGRYLLALVPLLVFGGFALVAGKMLYDQDVNGRDISAIPSALIGQKAPSLALPPLEGSSTPALTDAAMAGRLTLVNVFASWCVPCRQEHPILKELAKDERLTVVGINYKDRNDNALRFLGELGNPYDAIGVDPNGKAAIDWGVYGIPESYLVGPDGTILYKKVGPFDERSLTQELLPAIEKAAAGA